MELTGIGAVVTGASAGLGASLADALACAGAKVLLVARGERALEETAARIRALGGVAHAFAADVGDKRASHAIAGAAEALVGPVRLIVHNASTLGPVPLRTLLDTDCEELERTLAVNLVGPFRLTKALVGPLIVQGGEGLVVQVTSDAAQAAYPAWGAYGVSKAALEQMGRVWAAELEGTGVRFLNVDPGEMDTKMHADALPDARREELLRPAEVARRIVRMVRAEGRSGVRVEAREYAV